MTKNDENFTFFWLNVFSGGGSDGEAGLGKPTLSTFSSVRTPFIFLHQIYDGGREECVALIGNSGKVTGSL